MSKSDDVGAGMRGEERRAVGGDQRMDPRLDPREQRRVGGDRRAQRGRGRRAPPRTAPGTSPASAAAPPPPAA